ncbi:monofunctional biosynthetic peptidoglycan transglycosylase [Pararoseomonas indoligenes]
MSGRIQVSENRNAPVRAARIIARGGRLTRPGRGHGRAGHALNMGQTLLRCKMEPGALDAGRAGGQHGAMGRQELLHRPAYRVSWRRRLLQLLLVLLLGPLALIGVFRFAPVPATPLMIIRSIQGIGQDVGEGMRHDWVPLESIAPALAESVVAGEDNNFCRESLGFDFGAIREEVEAWQDGETPRGASTITMQTAKNLFLWPGRDPVRKLVEAWLTPQVALLWPKRRVIEVYLNSVEFGPGIYGAEAAARAFFNKPAARLTRGEAARLAAVLPSPLNWSAAQPSERVQRRAAVIERRVGQLGPLLDCLR